MNPWALSGLLTGISNLAFGIFVYFKNRKNKVNQIYCALAISTAIFGFGVYKVGLATSAAKGLFWWRTMYIGVIFIPIFLFHFLSLFLEIKRKKAIWLVYLVGLFYLAIDYTDLFMKDIRLEFDSIYYISSSGFFYPLFVVLFYALFFYCLYEMFRIYRESSGIKKTQTKYLLLAVAVGLTGGTTCYLPIFNINIYPIYNFTVALYPVIMTYAIIRYRFIDIRLIIGKGAIYFFSLTTVAIFGSLMMFLNTEVLPVSSNITAPLIACFGFLVFRPLFGFYQNIASKYFYYTLYSFQATVRDLEKKLNQIIELDKLTTLINNSLLDALKLGGIGIVLKKPEGEELNAEMFNIQEIINFPKEDILSFLSTFRKEDSFLIQYLTQTKKPIVREEIPFIIEEIRVKAQRKTEERGLNLLKKAMDRLKAGLFLPLLIKEEIIGIIILGNKLSGEAYTKEELDLLTKFSIQGSIAFNNALSYEEINKKRKELDEIRASLEIKVKARTKELERLTQSLEGQVEQRTKELQKKLQELEKFQKLVIGRELKMTELKKEIKVLKRRIEEK